MNPNLSLLRRLCPQRGRYLSRARKPVTSPHLLPPAPGPASPAFAPKSHLSFSLVWPTEPLPGPRGTLSAPLTYRDARLIKTSPANPPKAASARNPGAVRDRGLGGIGLTPAAPWPGCAPPLPPDRASPPFPGGQLRAPGTRCVCPHWPGIPLCTFSVSSANCRLLPFLCPLWHLKPQGKV